jgi:hypothetical protein
MKPLFVCLFFSFLLTFSADIAAQEAKQNPATAAKMSTKTVASGSVAPKAMPASASKPANSGVKKVKKSTNTPSKPESKGLFEDDYDGDIGIKYIGTEPASDAELNRVREIERDAKPVKAASKPVKSEAPKAEKAKKEPKSEASVEEKVAEPVEIKAEKVIEKVAEKPKPKAEVKVEMKVEPKKEVKTEARAEVKTEVIPEVKPTPKPAVKPASKSTARGPAHAEFDAMTIDLGNIKEDAVLERYFEFTNTGNSSLEILECRGSCGCIQPKAETTVVGAGERGRIYVKYVALNKVGPQKPVVTVTTNGSPSVIRLFIETWVEQIPGGVKNPTPATPKSENN